MDKHCVDCCCAMSWKALGITEYTGKSIPEHIELLVSENERLRDALSHVVIHGSRLAIFCDEEGKKVLSIAIEALERKQL